MCYCGIYNLNFNEALEGLEMPARKKTTEEPTAIPFTLEKDTKGTHRYREDSETPVIGTMYIRKDQVKDYFGSDTPPANVMVTIVPA